MGGKNENKGVVSPESVSIYLNIILCADGDKISYKFSHNEVLTVTLVLRMSITKTHA